MNFAREVVDAAPADRVALIELARDGRRRQWTFGEVSLRAAQLAGTLASVGVGRGDVVLTLIGNRPEWVLSMVACFRIGAVALPCNEQLRARDLKHRLETCRPVAIICDERNRGELEAAAPACPVLLVPDPRMFGRDTPAAVELEPDDPCLVTFTSGTSGEPKAVLHAQRYLTGQSLQAECWLGVRAGDTVWCTAATGWSKSARNVFIAPWLKAATSVLHDARFDPAERVELLARERVSVLCMAPTEYRMIARGLSIGPPPALRELVAAGEALDPEVLGVWKDATGIEIRDGYGQTETGQLTGNLAGMPTKPGSMGRALPGIRLWVEDGELVVARRTVPTFFERYLGERKADPDAPWHTGDRVALDEEGYLHFEGRLDDVIISAGYRIGPFEVESALAAHPAVAEAAVVAAPDLDRGSVVRAIVVLRHGYVGSEPLARSLQDHVKQQTAPYKYPRLVEFADALPKTVTGKISRARLRDDRG